ncbi:MAG: YbiU family protein, partial [Verrucomicrobiota bacterium]|nr:YbiU family protein [Verrucomicrobiota bacterium]
TLSLIPISNSIGFLLMRALQDDIDDDDLCKALPGHALSATPEYHKDILGGLISIPQVNPGDTVWWHPDIIHSVADEHSGSEYANVIYIGASPKCLKNESYARIQSKKFLNGESPSDFAPENYEIDFKGRAKLEDLTELGLTQMAL